jgi:phage terminase large subunit-like protein
MAKKPEIRLAEALQEQVRRLDYNRIDTLFPDEGELSRDKYIKHMEFFEAGATHTERCFMAGNRVGKTVVGCIEGSYHLTGKYPHWWKGRRFERPIRALCAGNTAETTRDILQNELIGENLDELFGTGLIPIACLDKTRFSRVTGITDAIDIVEVRHLNKFGVFDGWSTLKFRAYKQGRKAFEGKKYHVVLFDEEPEEEVYTEAYIRTMTYRGIIMLLFTPLEGITKVVLKFKVGSEDYNEKRKLVTATWDDAPHLTEEMKDEYMKGVPPHQRDARSKGIPELGAGAVWPILEREFVIDDFVPSPLWPRAYALDVGWNNTAALWGAYDTETDTWYVYAEYKRGQTEPIVHATSIALHGKWMSGIADPASKRSGEKDGEKLFQLYQDLGLDIYPADNAVEVGVFDTFIKLTTGRVKVMRSCVKFLEEFRLYRRDKNGKIVKENDHLCDDLRYLVRSGKDVMRVEPITDLNREKIYSQLGIGGQKQNSPLTFQFTR